jgi:hypothetical protein
MSTKSTEISEAAAAAAASKEGEKEDLGALIYREIQLRKREAVTAAVAVKKKSQRITSLTTHRVASTRRAAIAVTRGDDLSAMASLETNTATKRKRRRSSTGSDEGKETAKKGAGKKYRFESSVQLQQATAEILSQPSVSAYVSTISKCSSKSAHKNKKPPKKKTMETMVNKKRPHALWNRNYKIVKETCGTLLKMASHDSDGKRLSWSQFVGNEREDCPFLPGGKKFTYCKALKFPRGATVKEKNTIAQSVQSFINNAKKNQKTFPDWKRELLGQLELDICDDTRVWLL